jgi:hypothetical protein
MSRPREADPAVAARLRRDLARAKAVVRRAAPAPAMGFGAPAVLTLDDLSPSDRERVRKLAQEGRPGSD